MSKYNENEIKTKIQDYRDNKKSCSQSVLTGICSNQTKFTEKELMSLGKGFSGGIGGTFDEGTCGALTGAIIALGLLLSDDESKNVVVSKQLLKFFQEKYGTIQCCKLTDNGEDKSKCDEYCQFVGENFTKIMNNL